MRGIDRRQFLRALGLAGAASLYPSLAWHRGVAQPPPVPKRVVFFITPHGHVARNWRMAPPSGPTDGAYELDLRERPEAEWSQTLAPLHAYRNKLLVLDNLSHSTTMADIYLAARSGGDANAHHVGQAHLLTCAWSIQGGGVRGGARSVDGVIGDAIRATGQWGNNVYGWAQGAPYSYTAANEPAPRVESPATAYADIMGILPPPPNGGEPTRAERIASARASVLDLAADEYARIAPRLGRDDRLKLERHTQLVRDLEVSLTRTNGCAPTMPTGTAIQQFQKITAIALACDLTRVITLQAPPVAAEDFGAPPGTDIHEMVAHRSDEHGAVFSVEAEGYMTAWNRIYATQFRELLFELESVTEGSGTLLDNTAVVWLTELGTGTHYLPWCGRVVAGMTSYFRSGRYIRFPATGFGPDPWNATERNLGPSHNQLYTSLMRSVGIEQSSFGIASITDGNGAPFSLEGVVPGLT